ncbi:hypothetical protein ACRXCV_13355 [Halobacteriovorax sp. GFR7]|uniref:hypothetical protein n=1 Tax=unclassified Halobacteriovorax TaxID=2639665 RepID=UPI0037119C02
MTPTEKNNLFISNYFIVVTGTIYFVAKYFMTIEGDWGAETHPLSIWMQKLHILSVPFLLFFVGTIFSNHIYKRVLSGYKKSRTSGIFLIGLFVVMSLSGYLIQVSDNDLLRQWSAYIHLGVSLVWSLGFTYHHVTANR